MKKSEKTRGFIIQKSAYIINKKGMAGTSITDIMKATKLAKGGIYGNFESKEEICLEAFNYLAESFSFQLDLAIGKGKNSKSKFFNLLDVYEDSNAMEGGCPMLNFGTESDDTNAGIQDEVKKLIRGTQKRIFTVISDGIVNGEVSTEINPKHFSIKVYAMLEGGILCRRVLESNEQMKIIIDLIKKEFKTYLL